MALVSFVFSYVLRQLGTIVQALFGWSVTALFGRLPRKKQIAVSVALALSIVWPLLVLGLALPNVASWALTILPLASWTGSVAMRIVWGVLAVVVPPVVGGLVHWAAPPRRSSLVRAVLGGYPLALGFFLSFVVTVVTVPAIKVASIARGWSDEHVYVNPRGGAARDVVRDLVEACARAGLVAEVVEPPRSMELATTLLKRLASGAVAPISTRVQLVRADELEIYLYPADLLLRGDPAKVARVRAMMTRTRLDEHAYLVSSDRGQHVQDELLRLAAVLDAHRALNERPGRLLGRRLVEVWNELSAAELPFDEWVMLEAVARRIERRMMATEDSVEAFPLDGAADQLDDVAARVSSETDGTGNRNRTIDRRDTWPSNSRSPSARSRGSRAPRPQTS